MALMSLITTAVTNPRKNKMYKLLQERFEHEAGTIVYDSTKYDYGLSRDDTMITGVHHISVTTNADGDYPFFTVPVDQLQKLVQ